MKNRGMYYRKNVGVSIKVSCSICHFARFNGTTPNFAYKCITLQVTLVRGDYVIIIVN